MKTIKSKDTKPELIVRKFLFSKGLRFRLHDKSLPGNPDVVFSKIKTVIFIHGCFWHGHKGCSQYRMPKTSIEYWHKKINRNIQRDELNMETLRESGWHVIIIWECQLRKDLRDFTCNRIVDEINESYAALGNDPKH